MAQFLRDPIVVYGAANQLSEVLVEIHPDPETLALASATLIVEEARRSVKARRCFTLALAGGSTPKRVYQFLAQSPFVDLVPWEGVHVFWGDERCVDPADWRSNERMAREAFLDHVPIPRSHIHPMLCGGRASGLGSPVDVSSKESVRRSAVEYDSLLRTFFSREGEGLNAPGDDRVQAEPGCDLVLLGVGDDGHTASLFPGTDVLLETERWVGAVFSEARHASVDNMASRDLWRVTLTAPFINRATSVVFIASGLSKAAIIKEILQGPIDVGRFPAQLICPVHGTLRWYLDEDSASLLALGSEKE